MYGGSAERGVPERAVDTGDFVGLDDLGVDHLRLGHDIRFLFVAVGGGGIRIGRELAKRHPRYVETIAIHCDGSIQGLEEFDRRVTLEADAPEGSDAPTGPSGLARAAEPALERIFSGAAVVTIVGSLGGASGSGLLPSVVEAASREAAVVSVFAVKPFGVEAERRGVADRTLGRMPFLYNFVEKQQRGAGRLTVLDNEVLAQRSPRMPFNAVARYWADRLQDYLEREIIHPAELAVEAHVRTRAAQLGPLNVAPRDPTFQPPPDAPGPTPFELPGPPLPAAFSPPERLGEAELTFEIDPSLEPPR